MDKLDGRLAQCTQVLRGSCMYVCMYACIYVCVYILLKL